VRLFFALWPPLNTAEQLAGIARLNAGQFGGKPTRRETIHLTLAFLGEVPEAQLPLLIQAANKVKKAPFVLGIDRLSYWDHNHLLWAGSSSPSAALGELADNLRDALTETGFAVDGDKRLFTPHLTLIRKVPEARVPLKLPDIDPFDWLCSSFVLVRSQLSAVGPAYKIISDFPLTR
jgi:2'-5' RNA ligase